MIKDRHLELSSKLIEMGQALMIEGRENKDLTIAQTGSFMVLIGGLLFDEKDVILFNQLCSMFSAKKILDDMEANNQDIANYMRDKGEKESYEDFIRRINKLRGDNGFGPLL